MFIELLCQMSTPTHDVFYAATDIQNPVFHIVRRDRDTHAATCNCLRADCQFVKAIGTRTEDDEVSAWLADAGSDCGDSSEPISAAQLEAERIDAELDAEIAEMENAPACPVCHRFCEVVEVESGAGLGERIFCDVHDDVTDAIVAEACK